MKLSDFKGLGPKSLVYLEKKGITSPDDLILFYPYTYIIYESSLVLGSNFAIEVEINSIYSNKNTTFITFNFNSKKFSGVIFNQPYLSYTYKKGSIVSIYGTYKNDDNIIIKSINTRTITYIVPVYNSIKGLSSTKISSFIDTAFEYTQLKNLASLYELHFPSSLDSLSNALYILKYEEFSKWYNGILDSSFRDGLIKQVPIKASNIKIIEYLTKYNIEFTKYQREAFFELDNIFESNYRVDALLTGEVGSGKTYVYLGILLKYYLEGNKVIVVVPTKILASQIYNFFLKIIPIQDLALVKGKVTNKIFDKNVIVGTHGICNYNEKIDNLGLIIFDEQHKFGVEHKSLIFENNKAACCLEVTATLIPRTLAQSFYQVKDVVSIKYSINHIDSNLCDTKSGLESINSLLSSGNQVLVIVPYIEDNEMVDCMSIKSMKKMYCKKYPVNVLHANISDKKRAEVIESFENNTTQLLIATTLVEVGVNFLNLEHIFIFNSERFGMAQLHQLRGRVGRQGQKSTCTFITDNVNITTISRLNYIVTTTNGELISEFDLNNRGSGELMGTKQTGDEKFKLFNPEVDVDIMSDVIDHIHN